MWIILGKFVSRIFGFFASPLVAFTAGLLLGGFLFGFSFHYDTSTSQWLWWNRFDRVEDAERLSNQPRLFGKETN